MLFFSQGFDHILLGLPAVRLPFQPPQVDLGLHGPPVLQVHLHKVVRPARAPMLGSPTQDQPEKPSTLLQIFGLLLLLLFDNISVLHWQLSLLHQHHFQSKSIHSFAASLLFRGTDLLFGSRENVWSLTRCSSFGVLWYLEQALSRMSNLAWKCFCTTSNFSSCPLAFAWQTLRLRRKNTLS